MVQKIQDGRTDLVFDLWEENQKLLLGDSGASVLRWCAYYGDVSAIKFLRAKGLALDLLGENYDLNGAAFHGHWPLCQFLLEQGADPNFTLPDTGETALHAALSKAGRPAYNLILDLLIAHGANPNKTTIPNVETGSFMRAAKTKGETPLHRAAAFGDEQAIHTLIDAGADKKKEDAYGDTPLAWASWHQRPAAILNLLCYEPYKIHPEQVQQMKSDHGAGWGNGMEINLLGKIHL